MGARLSIAHQIAEVRRAMEAAAHRARRPSDSVSLVAVTKTVPWERVRVAWDAGARIFGENYVQEALTKVDRLATDAAWHMIGHLQSNKAKQAVAIFSCIESLDRPSLADSLEKAACARGIRVDALIQVNVGAESTKFGASPEGAFALAKRAQEWPSLRIRGLMVIPPFCPDPEEVRPYFRAARELRDQIGRQHFPGVTMEALSMGMSSDFEVAIEEGATLVRIGTAIFGERS